MVDFLFIVKANNIHYGVSSGLINSADFIVRYLNTLGVSAKLEVVVDGNDIDRVVQENNAKEIFLEAIWVPSSKMTELVNMHVHKHRRFYIRIHSKIPFLANEGNAFQWIKEYSNIPFVYLCPNTAQFEDFLFETLELDRVIYLPNIYFPSNEFVSKPRKLINNILDIGCFGAIRPLKNTLNQAAAAISFAKEIGKPLHFHVNGTRTEQNGQQVLQNLRALFDISSENKLIEHDWLPHDKFLELIQTMDIGMQVSFTESFNIVTADFVHTKTPIIVSPDVEWMDNRTKANPNDINDMVNKLFDNYLKPNWNSKRLKEYNHEAGSKWRKVFQL